MRTKRKFLQEASVLLTFLVLLLSNFCLIAYAENNNFIQNFENNETLPISYKQPLADGYKRILNEGFEEDKFPPDNWDNESTNNYATWLRNDNDDHWGDACAYCYPSYDLQDESLITPSVSFVGYNEIFLRIWWQFESWWWSAYENTQSLHIRISTDGGINWKIIWHEDYWNKDSNRFDDRIWQNSNRSDSIDLSEYIGEPDVKFDFRVYGDQGEFGGYIAIDDIEIWVDDPDAPNPIVCGIDGPFEGECAQTIQFEGWAEGGQEPYYWEWDFGEGNQSAGWNLNMPTNRFLEVRTYQVYCKVHSWGDTSDGDEFIITINITKPETATLHIRDPSFGIGFNVKLCVDKGFPDALDVNWSIHIFGGFLNSFEAIDQVTLI